MGCTSLTFGVPGLDLAGKSGYFDFYLRDGIKEVF